MTIFDRIVEQLDPDELVDILGLDTEELVLILRDIILTQLPKFDYLEDDIDE